MAQNVKASGFDPPASIGWHLFGTSRRNSFAADTPIPRKDGRSERI
jgi:hypothetical protein